MTTPARLKAVFLAVFLLVPALGAAPLSAQQGRAAGTAEPPALSRGEAQRLLETLESPEERRQLIERLKALAALEREAQPPEEDLADSLLKDISEAVGALSARLFRTVDALKRVPDGLIEGLSRLGDPAVRQILLEVVGKLALVFGAALLGEMLVRRLLAGARRGLDDRAAEHWPARVLFMLLRLLVDLVPVAAFAGIAYGVLPFTEPRQATRVIALVLINANLLSRIVALVARVLLQPDSANLRLLPMSEESAHYGYIWVRRLSVVGIYGFVAAEAARLLGLGTALAALLFDLVGLLLLGMSIVLLLQLRTAVTDRLRGEGGAEGALAGLRLRLAEIWHVLAIVYLLGIFTVWLLEVPGGFLYLARATILTLLILVAIRLAGALIDRGIARGFRLRSEISARYPLLEARTNRYLPLLGRILRGAVGLFAVLLLLQVWGLDIFGWLEGPSGKALTGRLLGIGFILLGAFILWEVVSALIESYLRRQADNGLERNARMETLLGLFQNALRVVLAVMVTLVILSELGIDIAPLLAGAGVVGLAIGFGAQTLVKDVITGVFLLIEDVLAVGDVVELAGHSGVVERITIRTVHLRDLEGAVHTLPFSEVTTIKNFGRGFSYALFDVGIAYRENTDEVAEVLREVAAEMRKDEAFRDVILADLEVLGLDSFGDSAVMLRARFKTKPLSQWAVRREFNRRMKLAFDARGIEIPFPHMTLYFGEDKQGAAPPLRLAEGTTSAVADREPASKRKGTRRKTPRAAAADPASDPKLPDPDGEERG